MLKFISFLLFIFMVSCNFERKDNITLATIKAPDRTSIHDKLRGFRYAIPPIELEMIRQGLVDIQSLDSTIAVELKYSTTDNFLKKNVYEGMQRAYLQPDVAERLVKAQQYLKSIDPELSLIVFDATRPRHVQQKMWEALDLPFEEKIKFLSNPAHGSVHNFGAAVDVSIIDIHGVLLDMGTEFDHLGELAYPSLEQEMLEEGLLKDFQVANRRLLRKVMRHGGFWGIQSEWWHFNAMTRAEAIVKYEIIE
jgi:zinc D-Ala-D-Ala dipeptidase